MAQRITRTDLDSVVQNLNEALQRRESKVRYELDYAREYGYALTQVVDRDGATCHSRSVGRTSAKGFYEAIAAMLCLLHDTREYSR